MKALTLTQPWATLVAIGAKKIETRSWFASYRGPLAIHAAKGFPRDCKELCDESPFREVLAAAGLCLADLPIGVVLCTTTLEKCVHTEVLAIKLGEHERAFGDYAAGRYGFVLGPVLAFAEPIPARGMLGFWEWEEVDGLSVPKLDVAQGGLF